LFGQSINYAVSDKHSFVLPKGKLELKSAYLKMNDTLDILNIKDSVVGTSTTLRTSGDMDGYDLELRYGLTKKDTIIINYQSWDIDYSEALLQNRRLELINRYNIYTNNYSFFNSLSIDIGYKRDSSDSLDFKKDNSINSLIKKIKPNSDIYLEDGDIHYGDSTFTIYDNVGNKIYPYISIENLSSTSYMARLLLSKKISYHSLFDIYVAYRDIKITTGINIYPKVSMIDNILNGHDMPILDRDEKNLDIGFSYTIESDKYIYEIDYQYTKIFRDSETSYIDYNHVLDASISKKVTKSLLLYIGGRLMLEQFNTDIPYLYNKYTKASFDKKYGFAKFGMVYSFRGI
jgi:hypothetical protein